MVRMGGTKPGKALADVVGEASTLGGAQLAEGFDLDLPDPLSGQSKMRTDFLE